MLLENRSTIQLSKGLKSIEEKVRRFQRKLYLKAKQERSYRFYILYDKIYRWDILVLAWYRVKKKSGSPGVDGESFAEIERKGIEHFLMQLQKDLKSREYTPQAVLRCWIEKANGKQRPLGIPTIRDRVVQMACKIVIEPIFEADFASCSYGFRPKRNAQGALQQIRSYLDKGCKVVLDADLSQYFDTIPHGGLMSLVEQRISDRSVLKLLRSWLKVPIAERTNGGRIRYSGGKRNKLGTPQGGVISPLLANIYLNELDKEFMGQDGSLFGHGAYIVRYADDFVILAIHMSEAIKQAVKNKLKELELELNPEKTRIVKVREESFNFLGFTFRYDRHLHGGAGTYLNIHPSKQSKLKLHGKIRAILTRGNKNNSTKLVQELNMLLRGWRNYYCAPGTYPRKVFRDINWYLNQRVDQFYRVKSQRRCKRYGNKAYKNLVHAGLVVL